MRHLLLVAVILAATPAAGQASATIVEARCTDGKDLWVQLASSGTGAVYVNLPVGTTAKVMDLPASPGVASVGFTKLCENMPGGGVVCIVVKPQPAIVFSSVRGEQTYCPANLTTLAQRPDVRR